MRLKNTAYNKIETIIFDFGNVLLDIDISLTVDAFRKMGIDKFDERDIHPNNIGIFHDMEIGKASKDDFLAQMRSMSSRSEEIADQQIIDVWNRLILPFDYTKFELLDKLAKKYNVILLSNTNKLHHDFFEHKFDCENPFGRPFKSFFDYVFYSDEMKLRKPEREIYEVVQDTAKFDPQRTLFIDDNAPNLVEPAKMGWMVHNLVRPETVFDLFVEE
ncbi:MAG: HAD family phosphatase [Mucinivorans sp.]